MKGSIPRQFIDDLLTKSNIVDVINARVKLKKAGRDYQACCPFHHEKTPSFTVSEKKQFYYCFGCGAKGNAISFLMDYDKLEDEEFWNKYKLSEIWYTLEMYEDDKKKAILLGTILVNLLVDKGYIIQIDYKEDIEDYIDNIKNFWGEQEIKLVRFELENDQNYYSKVPRISNFKYMYEVHILDER